MFGLGAILCVLLTGRPPFIGGDPEATRQLAAQGKLADAFARLDASGAEPGFIALAKKCLASDAADRPANGAAVAAAVAGLRADAEARAKRAEVAKAAADTRRRVLAWSAGVVVLVLTAGIGVSVWQWDRARRAEANALHEAGVAKKARDLEFAAKTVIEQEKNRLSLTKTFLRDVLIQASPKSQVGFNPSPDLTVREA